MAHMTRFSVKKRFIDVQFFPDFFCESALIF